MLNRKGSKPPKKSQVEWVRETRRLKNVESPTKQLKGNVQPRSTRKALMTTFQSLLIALSMSSAAAFAQSQPVSLPAPENQAFQPQIWVNLGGFSRHFSRDAGFNESNLGLGVEYRTNPEVSYMAGAYYNSVRKTTSYLAVNWQPFSFGDLRVGAALGLMNGYPSQAKGGAFFAALPLASWEGKRFGINFGLIPSIGDIEGAVIVQFKVKVH
jgi:hypothetical protein